MKAIIGIIGGSGIDQIEDLKGAQWNSISSPFGKSSDDLLFGEIDEVGGGGVGLFIHPGTEGTGADHDQGDQRLQAQAGQNCAPRELLASY